MQYERTDFIAKQFVLLRELIYGFTLDLKVATNGFDLHCCIQHETKCAYELVNKTL